MNSVRAFGPFQFLDLAGHGGMADVWRGLHRDDKVPVAIKVIQPAFARDEGYVSFFRNEARAVAGLDHHGIIRLYDYGELPAGLDEDGSLAPGSPYLVMEWASGGTARSVLDSACWLELKAILLDVLDALAHAHARGVLHRDIKPDNVLLCATTDSRPGWKIADFGIARPSGRSPSASMEPGAYAGTPRYMAPEQRDNRWRDEGPWTDLFALGRMVRSVLRPGDAFGGRRELPIGFGDWVERLVEPDPACRFRTAAEAAFVLRALDESQTEVPHWIQQQIRGGLTTQTVSVSKETVIHPTGGEAFDPTVVTNVAVPLEPPSEVQGTAAQWPPTHVPVASDWGPERSETSAAGLSRVGLSLYEMRSVRIVGRHAERTALWNALRDVSESGRARVVAIRGAAGTGKSRLAQWLVERAHEAGVGVALTAAHGPIRGTMDGLAPMIARDLRIEGLRGGEMLQRLAAVLARQGETRPEEVLALARFVAPDDPIHAVQTRSGESQSSAVDRHALVRRYLERTAADRVAIAWLDDVQWSLDLIDFANPVLAAQDVNPARILLVLTVRDESLAEREAESAALAKLTARDDVETIPLGPLPPDEHRTLVRELLGLDAHLAARVEERTQGNALFAVQLVGSWVRSGALRPGEFGFTQRDGASLAMPTDLATAWSERIEQLLANYTRDEARALEIAAVLGQDVDVAEWRAACGQAGLSTPDALVEQLLRTRLAIGRMDGSNARWSFAHGMLREVLLARAANDGSLRANHAVIASALAARTSDGSVERLGRHLLESGQPEAALVPLLKAASRNYSFGDLQTSLEMVAAYDRALDEAGASPTDPRRSEGLLVAAQVRLVQGRIEQAERLAADAERLAGPAGYTELRARALTTRGSATTRQGRREEGLALLYAATVLADLVGTDDLRRNAAREYFAGLIFTDVSAAREWMQRVLNPLADRTHDPLWLMRFHIDTARLARWEGRHAEGLAAIEKAVAIARTIGERRALANNLLIMGDFARYLGDIDYAERCYRESVACWEALGSGWIAYAELNLTWAYLARGRASEARLLLLRARRRFETGQERQMVGTCVLGLATCDAIEQRWSDFDRSWGEAMMALESGIVDPDHGELFNLIGQSARDAGCFGRARNAYERGAKEWQKLDRHADAEKALSLAAEIGQ